MKLTKFEKEDLKGLREVAEEYAVVVINDGTGVTIAYYKMQQVNAKMIAVAVSYMDKNETDKFRKKTGEYFALNRLLYLGEYVQMPLAEFSKEDLAEHLLYVFS